jgi:hypothetical protein
MLVATWSGSLLLWEQELATFKSQLSSAFSRAQASSGWGYRRYCRRTTMNRKMGDLLSRLNPAAEARVCPSHILTATDQVAYS